MDKLKILIALHSSTGNTRLAGRFAAKHLESHGCQVRIHDIVKNPDPPATDDVDLLCICSPTMYFRPTYAMEKFISRMAPVDGRPRPAFLLGTCAGAPGDTFSMLGEWLSYKGWVALGAKFVIFPSNWPPHVMAMQPLARATFVGRWLNRNLRDLRLLWGVFWHAGSEPDQGDRADLERFLDDMVHRAEADGIAGAPLPHQLHRPIPGTGLMGRWMSLEKVDKATAVRIDPSRCSHCGTCVKLCPMSCIVRESEEDVPTIDRSCSGCWSCYNHCPEGAISSPLCPSQTGRYHGASVHARTVFST